MRLLLDTHIAVWVLVDDARLSKSARSLIGDADNQCAVSVVSLWEIAIKHSLRKRGENAMLLPADVARDALERAEYEIVPVSAAHAVEVGRLPRLHGDPFDRLLVAQAVAEPFRLVTHDQRLTAYGETVILV